jgi:predicted PurR-regulated permease PerM
MNLDVEQQRIIDIHDEMSYMNLFKKTNTKNKLRLFIIPFLLLIISYVLIVIFYFKNNTIGLVPCLVLFFVCFIVSDNSISKYLQGKYYLKKSKDIYYHIFVKNLNKNGITKQNKIIFYIELLDTENKRQNKKYPNGFLGYLSLFFVPGLMIFFDKIFRKNETLIILALGLFFVPVFIFLFYTFKDRKKNKIEKIIYWLKKRKLELSGQF